MAQHFNVHRKIHQRFSKIWRKPAIYFLVLMWSEYVCYLCVYFRIIIFSFLLMFFGFSATEILYISSRVLLYVFKFNFSFFVDNGLEKIKIKLREKNVPWYVPRSQMIKSKLLWNNLILQELNFMRFDIILDITSSKEFRLSSAKLNHQEKKIFEFEKYSEFLEMINLTFFHFICFGTNSSFLAAQENKFRSFHKSSLQK